MQLADANYGCYLSQSLNLYSEVLAMAKIVLRPLNAPTKKLIRRLVQECKIMESRAEALMEHAIDCVTAYDVFGPSYESLLKADVRSLRRTVASAERVLGEVVALPEEVES